MEYALTLAKMATYYRNSAHYLLQADQDFIKVDTLLGRELSLHFTGDTFCKACGQRFAKLYRMGFCQNCFFTRPEAGESIIRPELSTAHLDREDRDLAFEKAYQLQPHVVYLANSGGLKVGVTRSRQKMHRWLDQGASEAIVLAETENRYLAGQMEVALKAHVGDKTPWQKMLKNEIPDLDLRQEKRRLSEMVPEDLKKYLVEEEEVFHFEYPVNRYPQKVKSSNLLKQPDWKGILEGIKGQYLILSDGQVLNVRSHAGFRVVFGFS